jgi:hypothetical protein
MIYRSTMFMRVLNRGYIKPSGIYGKKRGKSLCLLVSLYWVRLKMYIISILLII